MPSIAHSVERSPTVRRPAQSIARFMPAAVAGNCSQASCSPVDADTTARVWVRAWVSTPMTNGCACATMVKVIGFLP